MRYNSNKFTKFCLEVQASYEIFTPTPDDDVLKCKFTFVCMFFFINRATCFRTKISTLLGLSAGLNKCHFWDDVRKHVISATAIYLDTPPPSTPFGCWEHDGSKPRPTALYVYYYVIVLENVQRRDLHATLIG